MYLAPSLPVSPWGRPDTSVPPPGPRGSGVGDLEWGVRIWGRSAGCMWLPRLGPRGCAPSGSRGRAGSLLGGGSGARRVTPSLPRESPPLLGQGWGRPGSCGLRLIPAGSRPQLGGRRFHSCNNYSLNWVPIKSERKQRSLSAFAPPFLLLHVKGGAGRVANGLSLVCSLPPSAPGLSRVRGWPVCGLLSASYACTWPGAGLLQGSWRQGRGAGCPVKSQCFSWVRLPRSTQWGPGDVGTEAGRDSPHGAALPRLPGG